MCSNSVRICSIEGFGECVCGVITQDLEFVGLNEVPSRVIFHDRRRIWCGRPEETPGVLGLDVGLSVEATPSRMQPLAGPPSLLTLHWPIAQRKDDIA